MYNIQDHSGLYSNAVRPVVPEGWYLTHTLKALA